MPTFKFFVMLILSLSFSINQIIAQLPLNCHTECEPPVQWIYVQELNNELPGPTQGVCPTCRFDFEYWYRVCNGVIEIIMGTVVIHGDCSGPSCEVFPFPHYAATLAAKGNPAITDIFQQNCLDPGIYCYTDVKLTEVSCYKWVEGYPGSGPWGPGHGPAPRHTAPCDSSTCCSYELEICIIDCDIVTSGSLVNPAPAECVPGCFQNCLDWSELYKINILFADFETPFVRVIPNPGDGNFTILYDALVKGQYSFKVFDMQGTQVFEDVISAGTETMQMDISISNVPTGTFFYRLEHNETTIQTGKLQIIK